MREVWVDYAKALGIILVVAGHVNRGLYSSGIYISKQFYALFDSVIYSFHMPLFFFLSGLFFATSIEKKGKKKFFIDKLDTIFYPFVLWSLLQGGIEVILSQYTNSKTQLLDVLSFLFYPRAQFWFLYALLMIFIVAGIIYRKQTFNNSLPLIIIISFVAYIFSNTIGSTFHINYLTNNSIYFFLGCLFFNASGRFQFRNDWKTLLIIAVLFIALEYIFHFILKMTYFDIGVFTFILACTGIALITALSMYLASMNIKILEMIGTLSMVIYLTHILAGSGSRIVLNKILHLQNWYIHMLTGTLIGVSVPIAIYFIAKKYNINFLFSYPRHKKQI
ncbi:acyltransferase family protein [Klebsiella aerogenes]|uniref:acyltransferase family protein n=1 Tax=Klebsiella aerogenes TaxID=548 RepID=UPI0025A3139F|nr:acyltransferase [Klebsiella aerogenes]MDM8058401.1 acyltransferase [Klebsiella aerogenes]MDM8082425.1 acyltransferase [Klebsiella aerogenes]